LTGPIRLVLGGILAIIVTWLLPGWVSKIAVTSVAALLVYVQGSECISIVRRRRRDRQRAKEMEDLKVVLYVHES
jgi:hypothetical protein